MEQLFIPGSIIADHFYLGLFLLVAALLITGYIDTTASGAGLILAPAFLMVDLSPQIVLAQEKLVSTIGTAATIKNLMKSSPIIWYTVPVGIVATLTGAFVDTKVTLILLMEAINYIILTFLSIGLLIILFKDVLLKEEGERGEIKKSITAVFLTCLIIGFYDGFFDPGTDSVLIIALFVINRLSLLQASATSKTFNFASSIGVFVTFLIVGKMAFLIKVPMILANLLGNHSGSLHTTNSNGEAIRKVLVVTVLLIIAPVAYKTFSA